MSSPDDAELHLLRRRAQELSALFTSARELAAVRDADAVLERLVERAHEMLGADVTYLSEFDPDTRQLHVRQTHGAVSAAFRSLVVPPGRGLVGAIVESRMPKAVSRYGDYASERHEPVIDDAVAAEGIVSMLGVPLRTEDSVLGVIFVAMRSERDFAPEQIALLSALADHASVVLQTAATLRDLRRSEEEARAALEQLSAHLAERDRAHAVHQQLVGAVLAGGGFAPVAETLATTLGRPVRIADERGEELAASGDIGRLREAWDAGVFADALGESRRSGRAVPAGEGGAVVAALAAGARAFGVVVVGAPDHGHLEPAPLEPAPLEPGTPDPGPPESAPSGTGTFELGAVDLRTIERAAQVGALLALSEEAVTEAAHRQQSDLLVDLLAPESDRRADAAARVRRAGLDPDRLDRLVAIVVAGERRIEATRVAVRRLDAPAIVGETRGLVVVVAQTLDVERLHRALADALDAPVLSVTVPATGGAVAERFEVARRTTRLLSALGVHEGIVDSDELMPYATVLDTDQRGLNAFVDATVGAVRRYDQERGTELVATLRAFVRSGASPTRTARELTFHTNTILQRLERLDAILGAGWRDDERFFRVSLAVRLDELRERILT